MKKTFDPFLFFKIFISVFYFGFGVYLIVNPNSLGYSVSPTTTMTIGGVLIVYGLFRGYRTFKAFTQDNNA